MTIRLSLVLHPSQCIACRQALPASSLGYEATIAGDSFVLCPPCWARVARGGRTPRQTIEAILLQNDPNFDGGPDDPCDHEDYRDLELLGLWRAN